MCCVWVFVFLVWRWMLWIILFIEWSIIKIENNFFGFMVIIVLLVVCIYVDMYVYVLVFLIENLVCFRFFLFIVCMNYLGIVVRCRFWVSRNGVGSRFLFLFSFLVTLVWLIEEEVLGIKVDYFICGFYCLGWYLIMYLIVGFMSNRVILVRFLLEVCWKREVGCRR